MKIISTELAAKISVITADADKAKGSMHITDGRLIYLADEESVRSTAVDMMAILREIDDIPEVDQS